MNSIEEKLRLIGIPAICMPDRIRKTLGVSPWKLRVALESRSLPRFAGSSVRRSDLAKWIGTQPEILRNLSEMTGETSTGDAGRESLTLTPAALKADVCISINING